MYNRVLIIVILKMYHIIVAEVNEKGNIDGLLIN